MLNGKASSIICGAEFAIENEREDKEYMRDHVAYTTNKNKKLQEKAFATNWCLT